MVASLVLSLRMARLHGGMVLNGVLFARLMQDQTFTRGGDARRAARHNLFGASFLQFVLVDLIAGFSATVLALALGLRWWLVVLAGGLVFVIWLALYFRFHRSAAAFAFHKIANEPCGTFGREDWEAHVSASLESTNKDMLGGIGFVGLMLFSAVETLSGLGASRLDVGPDIPLSEIQQVGPPIFTALMVITCLLSLAINLRLRVAVGRLSLDLDPTDRPFRPFRLTDSFLGYVLLAFLFVVSLHLALVVAVPKWGRNAGPPLAIDAIALVLALAAEPITLMIAGRAYPSRRVVERGASQGGVNPIGDAGSPGY